MNNFDHAVEQFSAHCVRTARWKESYLGAAYSTRIRKAVEDLKKAIKIAEEEIIGK